MKETRNPIYSVPTVEQHNVIEFNKLIKDFLTNDIEDIQEALMDMLTEYVGSTEHDQSHVKYVTRQAGEVITFLTKLKTRFEFLPQVSNKEVFHA